MAFELEEVAPKSASLCITLGERDQLLTASVSVPSQSVSCGSSLKLRESSPRPALSWWSEPEITKIDLGTSFCRVFVLTINNIFRTPHQPLGPVQQQLASSGRVMLLLVRGLRQQHLNLKIPTNLPLASGKFFGGIRNKCKCRCSLRCSRCSPIGRSFHSSCSRHHAHNDKDPARSAIAITPTRNIGIIAHIDAVCDAAVASIP